MSQNPYDYYVEPTKSTFVLCWHGRLLYLIFAYPQIFILLKLIAGAAGITTISQALTISYSNLLGFSLTNLILIILFELLFRYKLQNKDVGCAWCGIPPHPTASQTRGLTTSLNIDSEYINVPQQKEDDL